MYIDFVTYSGWYKDGLTQGEFDNFAWEASRFMDINTTGIDGVRKLSDAAPIDEYTAESVKRCTAKIINLLYEVEQTGESVTREDGTVHGRIITSLSSGSESVSYAARAGLAQRVLSGEIDKGAAIHRIVKECLSGLTDANGVNLLYMGRYPGVL